MLQLHGRREERSIHSSMMMMLKSSKGAYLMAVATQVIYAGMFLVIKVALDHGTNSFVFVFYRQAAATILLLPIAILLQRKNVWPLLSSPVLLIRLFFYALIGCTLTLILYNVGIKLTSASVAAACGNSIPVLTFCIALLLRLETVKLRSSSGMAKLAGASLCLAGVLIIALYDGPGLSPIHHRRVFTAPRRGAGDAQPRPRADWIKGTFLFVAATVTWSLWLVLQAGLLKEYPNKLLVTVVQCAFSAAQAFVAAVVAERDWAKWRLRFDVGLLAILYSGLVVTGVTFYLQTWCMELKGPVFTAAWTPLCFVLTILVSSFLLGEIVHLGSVLGAVLLVAGLYSVLWGKAKEVAPPPHTNAAVDMEETPPAARQV